MRIESIILNNFRIYKGENKVTFNIESDKNVSLIAGKNGFGKTTFLTSLIWAFYGNLMVQVEEKYRKDIKSAGGYDSFLNTLLNKNTKEDYLAGKISDPKIQVEVHLVDVLIPSIPCKMVVIQRTYNFVTKKESLKILIDGQENELTKDVGYEVFINDFILPREISKFFFFDAEKIVTLAEAKSKTELRSLSKAYSEVLGIKKYEDLKQNLNSLLTKLRRSGVSKLNKEKLDKLIEKETYLTKLIEINTEDQFIIENDISVIKARIDNIQEKLIREGNEITLEELKELKTDRDRLKKEHESAKSELKNVLDIIPIVIAGKKFKDLILQINKELDLKNSKLNNMVLQKELHNFSSELKNEIRNIKIEKKISNQLEHAIQKLIDSRRTDVVELKGRVILDISEEKSRDIITTYNYVKESFSIHFKNITKNEKDYKLHLSRVNNKIKQAEARKGNPLAQKLREDKLNLSEKLEQQLKEKEVLIEKGASLRTEKNSNQKVLSEYEKNFELVETDKKKYDVSIELLNKLNVLTSKIKEEKKYSLQKSILLGLNKLMHKEKFISNVNVRIEEDVMDIDLLDSNGNVIDKDDLSKGEQQLYATALLKALVDESGIDFPVFIDSPLQKFDIEHSSNVIQQFYPTISKQVVLFPLLGKELSEDEYEQLTENLTGVYLIDNKPDGSSIQECKIDELFTKFNEQNYVLTN